MRQLRPTVMLAIIEIVGGRIRVASGWRRTIIAVAAGATSTLALAPFDFWPILFLTFPVLVWLTDGVAARGFCGALTAAVTGWWFGFGYFLAGLYWFGYAYGFVFDTTKLGWLLPIAVMVFPAVLAVFTALGIGFAKLIWPRDPFRILALAVSLTIIEWTRGSILTGFPWNTYGYALTGSLVLAQSAAWLGIWGLTFLTVAIFASPAVLADDHAVTRRRWMPTVCGLAVLAALVLSGTVRLSSNPTTYVEGVRLRLVQPNLQPDATNDDAAVTRNLSIYRRLSASTTESEPQGLRDGTHLMWPENALPIYRFGGHDAVARFMNFLPRGAILITGGARLVSIGQGGGNIGAYNSAFVMDRNGTVLSVYDKVHLVPIGEYLPFQAWLERLDLTQYLRSSGSLLTGTDRHNLSAPGTPDFRPLICYEAIFPDEVIAHGERPSWIVNLTNDGWFGNSAGPYQHFQQARVRAIEQGLPLVRVANTGISAIVDPLGRIIKSLPLDAEGIIDGELPRALSPTLYARYGDWEVVLMVGISLLFLCFRRIATERNLR